MPVLMRLKRLLETRALARWFPIPAPQQPRLLQHAPHAGRTHRHEVRIQHHERQPPIPFQRILPMEVDDGFLLPRLQPELPWHPAVVLIHAAIALAPVVELTGPDCQPGNESPHADLGFLRPAPDKIHHLVPHVVRHPVGGQSSPRVFFNATCSAINSARTSSLVGSFFFRNSIRFCFSSA
jgi:hypothetical protein